MFRRLVMAAVALAAAGSITSAQAQKGDEKLVLIGTFPVDVTKDKAVIDLAKSNGKFRGLRLRSSDGEITTSRVQVLYGDGSVHNEDRKIVLLDGERTRPIDQSSKDRFVDQVTMTLVPAKKGKAEVQVYGIATDEGAKVKRVNVVTEKKDEKKEDKADTGKIAATAIAKPAPTQAAAGTVTEFGDVLFGAQQVGFVVDRDVIRVGAEIGKFDKIRLRVLENDIFIKEMKVIYANGESDDLAVNAEVKRDTRTKWFQLKGDRFIREIQFVYNSKPSFKGQARIEVLGEYASGWLGPNGEGRKFNQGWVLLGAESAGFVGFDKDVIKVGRNEGGFKRLRVTVKDRAISLNELRIIYGSGQEDVVPIKAKVEAGSTYGPIDLKGGSRIIKEIQARYRSRFIDREARGKGRAIVEIWGQH
ncbi:MAG: DUF2541 family protein [Hyphomicrobiaceae bacterium]|nr:DUF2541 family protein [Hyphomicrobiaceae bacterium]